MAHVYKVVKTILVKIGICLLDSLITQSALALHKNHQSCFWVFLLMKTFCRYVKFLGTMICRFFF
jgi:hypothetical protein